MSLTVDGVWKAGVWNPTTWAANVWREGAAGAPGSKKRTFAYLKDDRTFAYSEDDRVLSYYEGN